MNIVVAVKVVPDDQDIQITAAGELDASKAHQTISAYDLNAIEAAAQLAATAEDSIVNVVTIGGSVIDDSKLKKNILARGADHLHMIADDVAADLDSYATACSLAGMIQNIGDYDVIICGDGSADNYAQQVDIQLASKLGIPCANGVVKLEVNGASIRAERKLEDVVELIEIPTPCVLAVSPDVALPRIPGMKDILKAGKKPMDVSSASDIPTATVKTIEIKAPEAVSRKLDIKDAADDGAIESFAAAIKAAL